MMESMQTMEKPKEVTFIVKLQPSLAEWLEQRATTNRRARMREVEVILADVRAKEIGILTPEEELAATVERQKEV